MLLEHYQAYNLDDIQNGKLHTERDHKILSFANSNSQTGLKLADLSGRCQGLSQSAMKLLWALLTLLPLFHCYGPHHPRGSHYHYKPDSSKNEKTKLTQNMEILSDKVHIQEDLNSYVREVDISKMTKDELAFHYFKIHDFDNNTKLDGLEILQAIKHPYHDNDPTEVSDKMAFTPEDFQYFIDLIDRALDEDDLDGDGYLSYVEYVLGREKIGNEQQKS